MEVSLKLELNEVNAMLDMMGAQPTSTNIWPLAAKIRAQAAVQLQTHSEGASDEGSTTD
jgi:hypothetical protein